MEAKAESFAEVYRGRHIQWAEKAAVPAGSRRADGTQWAGGTMTAVAGPDVEILIDSRPLHIMKRAGGSYLSLRVVPDTARSGPRRSRRAEVRPAVEVASAQNLSQEGQHRCTLARISAT
ncbi:tyrosinase family oxidase copper chaperone [Streptomyces sp. 21So2-11]|uniref:tyrosinase family oxidase copper chaperone n=1 Tax=Streptomyces sp. 21So2-11 TaxID=3144408 RepID=UPI0032199EE2